VSDDLTRRRGAPDLRAGDWVQVRSADEIVATLEADGALDGLLFMPEMLQYCGRRYRVYKSAHKTCDTVHSYTNRLMNDAVHLEGLRCDGSAHDGCQAACLIYWKQAWLRPVDGSHEHGKMRVRSLVPEETERLYKATKALISTDTEIRYRCQATDLLKATTYVSRRGRWVISRVCITLRAPTSIL